MRSPRAIERKSWIVKDYKKRGSQSNASPSKPFLIRLHSLGAVFNQRLRFVWRESTMMCSIDDHLRPQRTAPKTIAGFQTELGIRVHFTGPDADRFLDRSEQVVRSPEMTRGSIADVDFVTPLGRQTKGLVEGSDLHDPSQGHVDFSAINVKISLGSHWFSLCTSMSTWIKAPGITLPSQWHRFTILVSKSVSGMSDTFF